MDVICIGNLNFDISFHITCMPEVHQKVRSDEATLGCGGSAGNTACWLGSLGAETGIVGAVGNDPLGQAQLQDLRKYNVDTNKVKKIAQSGVAVVMVEGEAKRMIKFEGANQYKDIDEGILSGHHIHLSSNKKDVVRKVIDISDSKRILSWDPQELFFEDLLPFFDYVFMNEDDLKRETGSKNIEKGAELLDVSVLIVAKNGGGCYIFSETVEEIPSFCIEALDTTGAGDAFDAGFIFGLLHDLKMRECGILGTACASLKVQHRGARGGISTLSQLMHFLELNKVSILLRKKGDARKM